MSLHGVEVEEEPKPYLNLTVKHLPAIKNWQVGKTYRIELKVRQTSMDKYTDRPLSAGFEVLSVKDGGRALTKEQDSYMKKMSLDMEK